MLTKILDFFSNSLEILLDFIFPVFFLVNGFGFTEYSTYA